MCPEVAIFPARKATNDEWKQFTADNAAFFTEQLPGQDAPLGDPGGAEPLGPVDADTPLVAGWAQR